MLLIQNPCTDPPPVITCSNLSSPANGTIKYNNMNPQRLLGTVATYTCNPGYTLSGNEARTCESDMMWSGSDPTCQGKTANDFDK